MSGPPHAIWWTGSLPPSSSALHFPSSLPDIRGEDPGPTMAANAEQSWQGASVSEVRLPFFGSAPPRVNRDSDPLAHRGLGIRGWVRDANSNSLSGRTCVDPGSPRAESKRYPLGQSSADRDRRDAGRPRRRDQPVILRWRRRLDRETLTAIGISRGRVPAPSVWCETAPGAGCHRAGTGPRRLGPG